MSRLIIDRREEDTNTYKLHKNMMEKVKVLLEPEVTMTEEEKNAYENKMNQKIKMGKRLTQNEMNYIRRTNPIMYARILRIQLQREMLLRKYLSCRSKKEVEEVYSMAIAGISRKDPDKGALISAYDSATKEFKKSNTYKSLPLKNKKEREIKVREKRNCDLLMLASLAERTEARISCFDLKI